MLREAVYLQCINETTEERFAMKAMISNRIIVFCAMNGIAKEDPAREYMVAAMSRITTVLHKSQAYSRLPSTDADVEKGRKKKSEIRVKEWEEQDQDHQEDFDLSNWSPLQEVIDRMPKFVANA